jgi:hypothetical protein
VAKERLLAVYPNEMLARMWAEALEREGVRVLVKPQRAGYGGWGTDAFLPHALLVLEEYIEKARRIIQPSEDEV